MYEVVLPQMFQKQEQHVLIHVIHMIRLSRPDIPKQARAVQHTCVAFAVGTTRSDALRCLADKYDRVAGHLADAARAALQEKYTNFADRCQAQTL